MVQSTVPKINQDTPTSTSFKLLDKYYTSAGSSKAKTLSILDTTRDQGIQTGNTKTENEHVTTESTDVFSVTIKGHLLSTLLGIDSSRIKTSHGLTTLHSTVSPMFSPLPDTTSKIYSFGGSSSSRQDLGGRSTDQNVQENAVSDSIIEAHVTSTKHTNKIVTSTSYMNLHEPSFNFSASTLKTAQDQSTPDFSDITHITVSGKVQETTNTLPNKSEPANPTKQTLPITDNATTQNSDQAQTQKITTHSDIMKTTESTTRHSDLTISSQMTTKEPSAEPHQTPTSEQSFILTTEQPKDNSEISTVMGTGKSSPAPTKIIVFETTKNIDKDGTTMSTMRPTKTPKPRSVPTKRPMEPEKMENIKTTKPPTTNRYNVCDLLKDEAIKLRISGDDLQHIIEICTEMQQYYPLVSTPSPDIKKPTTDDINIPSGYTHLINPNWNQQPGIRIIQIVEEIYRRMNSSPMTNLTSVYGYTVHKPSIWLLLLNKIRSSHDPQMNLCIGQPVDGMTTLQNGSMVTFRGHYFWTQNHGGVIGSPRKITDVWGIPSPIDTVFTRCNCGGKTFFIKGSRYWRFTNDVMDQGYPKEIIKGFGGLQGKISAVLPVAGFRTRPESVYFFKPGGMVQKYTFRQEQAKRCTKKKRPSIQYPIYSQKIQTVKFRFPRDIVRHRIQIHRTYSSVRQPLGVLHEQTTVSSTWRGIPNNIISAVSLPNYEKQDGFDYYVFSKDKYYNINMSSKVAVKPPPGSEQKTSKDWYKCKE